MGYAQERASQILELQADRTRDEEAAREARDVVDNSGEELFGFFVSCMETEAKEFKETLPAAQRAGLKALRLNDQHLRVQTFARPLVSLDVFYQTDRATGSQARSARSPHRRLHWEFTLTSRSGRKRIIKDTVWFAVDQDLQPVFSMDDRSLEPSKLAEELFGMIADVFASLAVAPRVVA
jgi:hypothetical protein